MHDRYCRRAAQTDGVMRGHEHRVSDSWMVISPLGEHEVSVREEDGRVALGIGGRVYRIETDWQFGSPVMRAEIDGVPLTFQVSRHGKRYSVIHGGYDVELAVYTPAAAVYHHLIPEKPPLDTSQFLLSPMPGLLVSLSVTEGQEVKAGEQLAVIEAMKMENTLRAERDAVVGKIHAQPGTTVERDQAIIEFEH